mmetsp:Transcript_44407/g.74056  ORF Transcript_44407/g.74056 Transcript_44407/m.74056 type:complete len:202 (-) Transcript_44407:210-815(-)|eukprot:CAMPEP_0198210216 /NCGR_PEP_ID=MMETSP1445-20131203/19962_1 /TAXON_ID=36898 /ORGANISM="Pyramimonas sp., Strain CCMP2087" /LENGTH=201 /DNA_ID=CAMNT_0043884219 /DNA_START=214 /DNA_END=819 /DNA_ORIENTATION=+
MAALSADEEAIIRKRLITQTAKANGASGLHKLTKRFLALCSSAEKGDSLNTEALYQTLMKELAIYELQVTRLDAMRSANYCEQGKYKSQGVELEKSLVQVQAEIEELKVTLEQAREERAHKEEYEVLRRLCMEHPARSATRAASATLEQEIEGLEKESAHMNGVLELRKKQFALLLHAADELQTELEDEAIALDSAAPMEL